MSETSSPPQISEETWQSFRAALETVVSEAAPQSSGDSGNGLDGDGVKRMVTEAVGAVLLEGNLFEKVLVRSVHKLSEKDRADVGDALVPNESIRKTCEEAFRSMTLHTLVPALQKQIKENLGKQLLEMGKTEEFKSLLDSRFRMMEQYLRADVIPKMVEQIVAARQG